MVDASGAPIERATLRAVRETFTSILERDTSTPGIFLSSLEGLAVDDHVLIGEEVLRVDQIPAQSCLVVTFASLNGQRLTYFDTTPEEHGLDKPAYKVEVHPPGAVFTNNGLPVRHLYFRNDDGGPGFEKDSRLHFRAPADGDYLVRIRDVPGMGRRALRVSLDRPKPKARFSVECDAGEPQCSGGWADSTNRQRHPPGRLRWTDQRHGPGFARRPDSTTATIPPGQFSATLLLHADPAARLPQPVALKVRGQAEIDGNMVTRFAGQEELLPMISLMPQADISMNVANQEIILEAGTRKEIEVSIDRQNGFTGRTRRDARPIRPECASSTLD